jgi:hypothetical protein
MYEYSNIDISVAVVLKVLKPGRDQFLSFSSASVEVMVSSIFQIFQVGYRTFYYSPITLPSRLILARVPQFLKT